MSRLLDSPKKIALWIAAALSAAGLAFAFAPTTGAVFTDEENGTYELTTGTVAVGLDASDLQFANLGTGVSNTQSDSFTVTNAGSLKMTASLCDLTIDTAPAVAGEEDLLYVQVKVNGAVVQEWTSASELSSEINLGAFNSGTVKNVRVEVYLDESASNAWQGQTASGGYTVCAVEEA